LIAVGVFVGEIEKKIGFRCAQTVAGEEMPPGETGRALLFLRCH
jgi:hypothetical protein